MQEGYQGRGEVSIGGWRKQLYLCRTNTLGDKPMDTSKLQAQIQNYKFMPEANKGRALIEILQTINEALESLQARIPETSTDE